MSTAVESKIQLGGARREVLAGVAGPGTALSGYPARNLSYVCSRAAPVPEWQGIMAVASCPTDLGDWNPFF